MRSKIPILDKNAKKKTTKKKQRKKKGDEKRKKKKKKEKKKEKGKRRIKAKLFTLSSSTQIIRHSSSQQLSWLPIFALTAKPNSVPTFRAN